MSGWQYRPARDQGLSPAARLRSPARERGVGSHAAGACWQALVRTYLRLFHGFAVTGREHLPAPPFVLVANHSSHLDALALSAALPRRLAERAYALAAGDTFFTTTPAAAFAAYAINALPVRRGRTSAQDIQALRARLVEDGDILILFPEGTRTRTGSMGAFRPGIGALVGGTEVPVVPAYLDGGFAAWPPTRRLPRPGRLQLVFGPPQRFPDAVSGKAGLMALAGACEQAVRALAPGGVPPGA